MKIALDVMGSDNHPAPEIDGAVMAAREYGIHLTLVGDENRLERELAQRDVSDLPLEIVHAGEAITMTDKPAQAAREKRDSSVHIGLSLVEDGKADAFVSCGNTGAILAIATLQKLRRIRGVHRPALSSIVPFRERHIILVDIGANVDSKAEWLSQFALMGSVYAQKALGYPKPRVALLSNGEEEGKGYSLIHETAPILAADDRLNFVGNIEPKEIVQAEADVIVSDGFVGNILIKSLEAMGMAMFDALREEVRADLRSKLGGVLLRPTLRRVYKQFDPFEIGGAPLLGVDGVVIIGHGRSNANAIKNAIRQAKQAVEGRVVDAIRAGLGK